MSILIKDNIYNEFTNEPPTANRLEHYRSEVSSGGEQHNKDLDKLVFFYVSPENEILNNKEFSRTDLHRMNKYSLGYMTLC